MHVNVIIMSDWSVKSVMSVVSVLRGLFYYPNLILRNESGIFSVMSVVIVRSVVSVIRGGGSCSKSLIL